MDWYRHVLRRYAEFHGRAGLREFWTFVLINFCIVLAIAGFEALTGISPAGDGVLSSLYSLFVLLPSLAVTARRLHDTGRSGWWMLLPLIPVLGALVLLFFLVQGSRAGAEDFGPPPPSHPIR